MKWLQTLVVCTALASLPAASVAAAAQGEAPPTAESDRHLPEQRPRAALAILSSPPHYVSGGDARIEVTAPVALHARLGLWLNGRPVEPALQAHGDRLQGVVAGMTLGDNLLELRLDSGRVLDSLKLTNFPTTGPMFSGPQQTPFVCRTDQVGRQPLVDSATPPGYAVVDAQGQVVGYSRDCSLEPFVTYLYRTTADTWQELPRGAERPADMRSVTVQGRTVDFIVRRERGTINRFLYSFAMLAPAGEDPARPDLSLWNGRLQYWFQGGVGVGHSQGRLHHGSMNPEILASGTAIVHSSGNNTSTHYNLQLAGETALMTKERFIERYGVPLYTYGIGGSGGAIQQYVIAQSLPGVLDAALPVQSYPDMVTQTIHALDCELLEYYMDATDRANPKWRVAKQRSWLVGMNAEKGVALRPIHKRLSRAQKWLGYGAAKGSTECAKSWRGVAPLTLNPHYGRARNSEHYVPQSDIAAIRWTHWDDLRNIYGADAQGAARTTFDNVGVQYGLQSLREGRIAPAEFLDLNFRIGGWKHPSEMVQEGFPFLGLPTPWNFDPWSRRNMTSSPDEDTPAPRTRGDLPAMRAAYTSGMVFDGELPLPTIDHRHYMERELDMHNTHQSFAVRKRVMRRMGHSDHLVIWFTDTMPGVPKAKQSYEAIEVMDEWMAAIRANPQRSIGENRPPRAVDSCFDAKGQLIYAGNDAWNGILDSKPKGPCARAFPLYSTSRIVAGAPLEGSVYRCALKPIAHALVDGTYAPWQPNEREIATLERIFPEGVCDYGKPDQARPPALDAQLPARTRHW